MTARLLPLWLFALLMVLPLPFLPEYGGANSATRFMLSHAILADGTTEITPYADVTPDKAQVGDAFYSDKAPGMALMALPVYAVGRAMAPDAAAALMAFDRPLDEMTRGSMVIWRLLTWLTAGLLYAAAGAALYRMCRRLGGAPNVATLAVLTVCLATPLLGWSAQFFGHVGAGAALALAFALTTGFGRSDTLLRPVPRALLAGAALSLAVSIEYTAAPAVLLIVAYAVWRLTHLPARSALVCFAVAFGAAIVAAIPMLAYHWVSFGGPFRVGYSSVVGFEGMDEGLLGITLPDPEVLWRILFGFRRGIIWLSPVLVFVPVGLWLAARRRGGAGIAVEMWVCAAMIAYYFLLNASYFYWGGGASLGPRHTLPSLFFMVLPFMVAWAQVTGVLRWGLAGLFGLSVFLSIASASVNMTTTRGWFPIIDPILRNFFSEQNDFVRMASWGLSPLLVWTVWLVAVSLLATLIWRAARADH